MYLPIIIDKISSHSTEEYPFECCGVILESTSDNRQIVHRCKNIQNELHKSNPKDYPRDAHTAYTISPEDLFKVHRMTQQQDFLLKAIYHSHPDHKAYFSEEDHSFATFNDEPAYPGVDYIIVSIIKKEIKEVICFYWDNRSKKYAGKELK